MVSRRGFIRTGAAGLMSLAIARVPVYGASDSPHLGAQLYTVREQAEKDLPSVLAEIARIGYKHVETYAGLYNRPAIELRRIIQEHGLTVPSGLFNYDDFDARLPYARDLGLQYMVCSMLPPAMWTSLDSFRKAADQFNRWGDKANKLGMTFAFHNHNVEFRDLGGGATGWDTLIGNTDPKLVHFEMDCYWITQAGLDPVKMLGRLGGRVRILHLKDRKAGYPFSQELGSAAAHFTEVGAGTLDWRAIFDAARKAGVEYQFVERDSGDLSPIESLQVSFRNLQKLLA